MRLSKIGLSVLINLYLAIPLFADIEPSQANSRELSKEIFSPISTARNVMDMLIAGIVKYSFQVIGGIVILVAGWMLAGFVSSITRKFLIKHNIDVTINKFISGAVKLVVVGFAVLVALGKFGIEIAPFVAGLSVVGFGTSFALQGPLSNYAAGASLIFTKPFKVGDIIEVAHVMGQVEDITLPRTLIRTVDGTLIVVPNKHIIGEIIHNFSQFKRTAINVEVGYSSDIDQVISVIKQIIKTESRIHPIKDIQVGIEKFADSGLLISAIVWCKQSDYFDVLFEVNKKIYTEFKKYKIDIPFPQRVVHLRKEDV